jgi:hypothetical protein
MEAWAVGGLLPHTLVDSDLVDLPDVKVPEGATVLEVRFGEQRLNRLHVRCGMVEIHGFILRWKKAGKLRQRYHSRPARQENKARPEPAAFSFTACQLPAPAR